jgi:hypothetical protein
VKQTAIAFVLFCASFVGCRKETNIFSFCRDFTTLGCIEPLTAKASFNLAKTIQNKTLREFYNSIYFRGDRLAFELKNADARKAVDFDCLHGRYSFGESAAERFELEYIELREKNVYGLVMLGSMIEKLVGPKRGQRYKPLPAFEVTYEIFCGKDPLVKRSIMVEIK